MKKSNRKIEYVIPFFIIFAVITVIAWLLPLRPTDSVDEKRELAHFPKFSFRTFADGDYFTDIDTWFSDTFTLRNRWISLSERVEALYGHSDIAIYGGLTTPDAIPVEPTPQPTEEISKWDVVDKDNWHGKVVDDDDFVSFGTVLQIDDACYEFFYFYKDGADKFASLIERTANIAGDRAKVYSVLAPTAIGIMFEQDYLDKIGAPDESEALNYIYGQLDKAKGVDTFNALRYHNGEYLYFRTDHHWTAQAAYYAYRQYCKTAGISPADLSNFEEKTFDNYYGSLWSYAKRSNLISSDAVHAFVPPGDLETVITTSDGDTYPISIITDMTNADKSMKYLCFISGDNPFTHITNKSLDSDKNCLVIKDSFGNCFVPYLTQNYKNVYVVDYRSYREMTVNELIDTYNISDIIFVNSVSVALSDITTQNIEKVVGK